MCTVVGGVLMSSPSAAPLAISISELQWMLDTAVNLPRCHDPLAEFLAHAGSAVHVLQSPVALTVVKALWTIGESSATVMLSDAVCSLLDAPTMANTTLEELVGGPMWAAVVTACSALGTRLHAAALSDIDATFGVAPADAAAAVDRCLARLHRCADTLNGEYQAVRAGWSAVEDHLTAKWSSLPINRRRALAIQAAPRVGLAAHGRHLQDAVIARKLEAVAFEVGCTEVDCCLSVLALRDAGAGAVESLLYHWKSIVA